MAKKKSYATKIDLRTPLIICAIIGALLLAMFLTVVFVLDASVDIRYMGAILVGTYVVAITILLASYLIRYHRIRSADDTAELLNTELSDMFRYVVEIPYAVIDEEGTVKIVSGALQEMLQFRSPVCNVPLTTFCTVPIADIIAYAQNGGQVRDIVFSEDGVPIDRTKPMITEIDGKKFGLSCYILRSRGKDYYFVIFRDITELEAMRRTMYENEPVVAHIVIDSLQELAQYILRTYVVLNKSDP